MIEIDLTRLPPEVTDYGFDQLPDLLNRAELEDAIEGIAAHDQIERDYPGNTLRIHDTVLTTTLRHALYEKVEDLTDEALRGDRTDFDAADAEMVRRDVREAFDGALVEVDLSELPDEVVDYGFDQFPDRFTFDKVSEEIDALRGHDQFHRGYDEQVFLLNDSVPASILRGALYEKVDDIAAEVRRGDRTDYSMEDIERLRAGVREAFTADGLASAGA